MRKRATLIVLITAAYSALGAAPAADRIEELRGQAREAYQNKDFAAFEKIASELVAADPGRLGSLYDLACARSLNGKLREASESLLASLAGGLDFGLEEDPNLAALRASPEFERVRAALAEIRKPLVASVVAFELPEKDLLTEGLAFDTASGDFFISSVHHRKIVRRSADGKTSDFVVEGRDGIDGVLALAADSRRRVLWACSAALPQMVGWTERSKGRTGIFAFDLDTGRLRRKIVLPADGSARAFNDLVVDAGGRVEISDGGTGAIFRAGLGADSLEEILPAGTLRSAQGMAISADGSRLYVADYGRGVSIVDLKSRRASRLEAPSGTVLHGIDGLARAGNDLVVTQNLFRPARIARLRLKAGGDRIEKVEILEKANPLFVEPTLGVIVGGDFYFIARSQWSRFDEKTGAVDRETLVNPLVLKLPLPAR